MKMEIDADYVLEHGDPRVETFPMMQSPKNTLLVIAAYLIFTKVLGPILMRNRKPFELRIYMMVYNAILVVLSGWMFLKIANLWFSTYSWRCQSIDFSDNHEAIQVLIVCYVFYLTKFLEFFDTIFFVLRKKYTQITFLHTFHHAATPLATWYFVKYGGGGYATMFPLLNSFVHVWMYAYYGLAALGPSVQKYLWWKKHITKLQLLQFTIGLVYFGQLLLFPPENCNARDFVSWLILGQAMVFFVLFSHFYVKTYQKSAKHSSKNKNIEIEEQNHHHSA